MKNNLESKEGTQKSVSSPYVAKPMRHKIFRSFLLVSFLSILLIASTVIIHLMHLRTELDKNTESFVTKTNEMFSKNMTERLTSSLVSTVDEKASLIEDSIFVFKSRVEQVAHYATQMYTHPELFVPRSVEPPLIENVGKVSVMKTFQEGVNPASPALQSEVRLLGAASDILRFHRTNGALVDEIFLETTSGICVSAGTDSEWYIGKDGKPLPYNLDNEPYIKNVFRSGIPYFSPSLVDDFSDDLFVAYSVPFYRGNEIAGVACATMVDTGLFAMLERIFGGSMGTAFILDVEDDGLGNLVYSTAKEGELRFDKRKVINFYDSENRALSELMEKCMNSEHGLLLMELDGEEQYVAYARVASAGWAFLMTFPKEEILSSTNVLLRKLQKNGQEELSFVNSVIVKVVLSLLIIFSILIAILLFVARRLSYLVTKPMKMLMEKVCTLNAENLSFSWNHDTKDEVQILAQTFSGLVDRMKKYIADVVSVTSEKEKISTELCVATNIQADMLPKKFPDCTEFNLYASMRPAKEVGGDFYDFFMVDKRHLAIVVADVSGKGVPAALFMVIGKTLIKDHTVPNVDLGKAFTEVNDLLFQANGDGMFITAFEGILDLFSGEFRYVNAGHEPPYIFHNGTFEARELEPAFVLAGMPGMKYEAGRMMLEPGDKIFQYTDGVTEATNASEKLYGFERLGEVLNEHGSESPCGIIKSVSESVDAFVGEAPQFDDITMLCLEYKNRMEVGELMISESFVVAAETDNLSRVQEFVTETMKKGCASSEAISQIDIATEEVFVNIASYAYPDDAVEKFVWVSCHIRGNDMTLTFKDRGVPYNPLEKQDPDVDVPVQDMKIGGLGIFMTKQLAEVGYEYADGCNILTLRKKIA